MHITIVLLMVMIMFDTIISIYSLLHIQLLTILQYYTTTTTINAFIQIHLSTHKAS